MLKQPLGASNVFHLTVLGRALLSGAPLTGGPSGCRPRPLALLSILAASGDRGISRERLLLYLWPESDARHARNTLSQTLYALKRDLGSGAIVTGTTVLALDRLTFTCDLWDFERALGLGADEEAVESYGGAFLDEFAIPGLVEFEQWVGAERMRLEREYRGALERLATSAEQRGDPIRAIGWWRRFVDAAPLSATGAMGLMRALTMAGDRSAALEHARAYAALVRTELDSEPESTVTALVDRIRRASWFVDPAGAAARESEATPIHLDGATREGLTHSGTGDTPPDHLGAPALQAMEPAPSPATLPMVLRPSEPLVPRGVLVTTANGETAGTPRRSLRVVHLVSPLALLLVLVAAVIPERMEFRPRPQSTSRGPAVSAVAVMPFAVAAPDSLGSVASGIMDLLAASLEGADVEVVDPIVVRRWTRRDSRGKRGALELGLDGATHVGATSYVTGEIALIGKRIRITALWYDRRSAPGASPSDPGTLVTYAVGEGEPARLLAVIDHVAAQLLAGRHTGPAARLTRAAAEGTHVPAAFKAYLRGEQELQRWEFARAVDEFSRAVSADDAFALGYYRLSLAADRAGRASLSRASALHADALAGSLAEHDQSLVHALLAARLGQFDSAERQYRAIIRDYPDDAEAWFHLGDLLFHGNPLVGRSALDARDALEQATRLSTDHTEALVLLARIAAAEDRRGDLDSLVARIRAGRNAPGLLETQIVESVAHQSPALRRSATSTSPELAESGATASPLSGITLEAAVDPSTAREIGRPLTRPEVAPDIRALGYLVLARAEAARGRVTAAVAALDSAQRLEAVAALEQRVLLASAPFLEVLPATQRQILAQVSAQSPENVSTAAAAHDLGHTGLHAHIRLHSLGLLYGALREHERARLLADSLERLPTPPGTPPEAGRVLAQSVRATSAFHAGRYADVLRVLGNTPWPKVAFAFEAEVHDRFLRAEALFALGRFDEAAGWYSSIAQRAAYERVYLAPSELRLGEIAERRGKRAQAARHYRRFVELWADADPALQPKVAAAQERLAALTTAALRRPMLGQ